MRKRDCIEFLWDRLKPFLPKNYTVDESIELLSILEQAKAMHKEEVLSFDTLLHKHEMEALNNNTILLTKEEFYNETFGGQQ